MGKREVRSDEERAELQREAWEIFQETGNKRAVSNRMGVPYSTAKRWIDSYTPPKAKKAAAAKSKRDEKQAAKEQIEQAALHTPVDVDLKSRIRELEANQARLTQQLAWAQRADSAARTGGLFTLRASDHHYGDKNHLLSCGLAMQQKVVTLVEQYEPDAIQIIAGDDWIAGRGIYKEQDLDMASTDEHQQCMIGAVKAKKMLQGIREVCNAPIVWRIMRGNHDFANKMSMTETLFYKMRAYCDDVPDCKFVMHWDSVTANLAYDGTYNVLARHGFGYSKNSPNSPAFIDAIKDEIIAKQRLMQPGEHYQRILSGHTHWFSIGLERQVGLYWDTTGGLQRNTRIRLGANQRPVGWIVYVSPPGLKDNILAPIPVQPDEDTYRAEIEDPHLDLVNIKDASDSVREFSDHMREKGEFGEGASFGVVNQGRW